MHKKDYELLSRLIKTHSFKKEGYSPIILKGDLVNDLCEELKKDNPNFDGDKFRAACGLL